MATKELDRLYHQFLPTAWISEYTMEYGHKESDRLYHQFLPTAWISEYTMEYGHERIRQVMPSISAHSMDLSIHDGI